MYIQSNKQHITSEQEWYSPPFDTHPGGYKMCIKVYANGRGDGADTRVSVYALPDVREKL